MKFTAIKSFFTVKPRTYCRLQMSNKVKKLPYGKSLEAGINKAFQEISKESGRRYFIVEHFGFNTKTNYGGFLGFKLYKDNYKEAVDFDSTVNFIDTTLRHADIFDPGCKQPFENHIATGIKAMYHSLKNDID